MPPLSNQLKDATAKIDEQAKSIADLTAKLTAAESTVATLQEEAKTASETHAAAIKDIQGKLDDATARADKAGEDLKAEQDAHKATSADLDKAKARLEGKDFKDASGAGGKPVGGGGDAGGDSGTPLWDQYNALTSPAAKTAFFKANQKEMDAELQSASQP